MVEIMPKKISSIDKMYDELKLTGASSNLRLTLRINSGKEMHYAYDKGIRQIDDANHQLSIINIDYDNQPRFLEDYIKLYGRKNVSVHEYGKYGVHEKLVKSLLSA